MRLTDEQKAEISGYVTQAFVAGHDLEGTVLLGAFVLGAEIIDDAGRTRYMTLHFNGSDAHLFGLAHMLVKDLEPERAEFEDLG